MYMTSHNTDTSILIQRNDIINLPNPKTVYQSITGGLCNQLFRFINGIIRCAMAGKKFIVIDYFLCCLKKSTHFHDSSFFIKIEKRAGLYLYSNLSFPIFF